MLYQSWYAWDWQRAYLTLSLSRMKNLGMAIELHPKGDKITCPAFGWYSSPAEYSTVGHFVLDLTSLSCQSRERSAHPKRQKLLPYWKIGISSLHTWIWRRWWWQTFRLPRWHCRFWRWRRSASGATCIKKRTGERNAWLCRRTQNACTVSKQKTSSLASAICHSGTRCVRKLAWVIRRSLDFGPKSRWWSTSQHHKQVVWWAHLEGSSPETTTMSTAQFKKRTTHLNIRGKVYDPHKHVVKTCPFCNSTKPRPDRARVSGL